MTHPETITPKLTHRRPSPGEPTEPVVIDAQSGEELVVVAPQYASLSGNKRRFHLADIDTHPAIETACSVARHTDDDWQYRRRSTAEAQGVCCQYCSGETSYSEISEGGNVGKDKLAYTLEQMSVAEFDSITGAGGPADD